MSTKPTEVPTWGAARTNEVVPSGGLQAAGWALNALAVSSVFNWLGRITAEWCQYLYDGDLEMNSLDVETTLNADGAATLQGGLVVTGGGTSLTTTTVNGTLNTTSAITVATNTNINLSGTGHVVSGATGYTAPINYPDVVSASASGDNAAPGVIVTASGTAWFPIRGLLAGMRVSSIAMRSVSLAGPNNTTYTLEIAHDTFGGTYSTPVSSTSTAVTVTPTTPIVVTSGDNYWIKVVTAAGSTRTFWGYDVYYDVP